MAAVQPAPAHSRSLLSGNEAVARAVWDAGVRVAAAYPGTPSTEILESIAAYPDIYAEWSVNEKVSLEVAIGASMAGSRAFCAMKHVGMNVASDALMTITMTGVEGGLLVAIADDVGMSSSQNEQDSRFWGRFAHLPVLEPADSQEAYDMTKYAYSLSEQFETPVMLRLTTRICHVKALVTVGEREPHEPAGFIPDPQRWVMVPAHARHRVPLMYEREHRLRELAEASPLNTLEPGRTIASASSPRARPTCTSAKPFPTRPCSSSGCRIRYRSRKRAGSPLNARKWSSWKRPSRCWKPSCARPDWRCAARIACPISGSWPPT